jgi:transcriptional regulator with XRE-family HTH domain
MDRIRQLRKERGLSQAKLAVMADMDPATLNRLERGTGNPNLKTLERVANVLDVGVADLLPKALRRSSPEPTFNDVLDGGRRASLRSWVGFVGRLADRWSGEIEEREAVKKRVMMLPNLHWAVEIMGTYTDVVEAVAADPNYDAWVYAREEVRELYAATRRMKEAVDRTKVWFPSRQEDPKMAEVIDLRRAAIERAEKRLGARAS